MSRTGRQNTIGRRDANEKEIIATLRACGCLVEQGGPLDLIVGLPCFQIALVECKDGSKPPSKRKLTDAEEKFILQWRGYPVHVLESVDDALALVNGAIPR